MHLESDRFFDFIASGYIEPWRPESHAQNEMVMRIVAGAAAAYAAAGYFTIVDGIVLPQFFFEPLRDALSRSGATVAYAVLRAPLELCLKRASGRRGGALAEPGVVERLWRDFAELGALEPHAVEVGAASPAAVTDVLQARLRDGSLRA